jgi:uncharacterized protein (DUF885 family)
MNNKKLLKNSLVLSICLLSAGVILPSHALVKKSIQVQEVLSLEKRQANLDALLKEQWEYKLRTNPELASILGDKRYNAQLRDFSQAAIDENHRIDKQFLLRFKAIDASGFSVQEKLNKDLMISQLQDEVDGVVFESWQMPVLHNSGLHLDTPELVNMLSFSSVKDYDDYIARLNKLPHLFEQTMQQMRLGIKNKIMPPHFLIPKIARQCDEIVAMSMNDSPFTKPIKEFPESFSDADQQRLRVATIEALEQKVLPTYKKFANFIREEYAPHGRADVGLWSLPKGEKFYQHQVRTSTTTNLTPQEIHEIGLSEVSRIEGQMLKIAQKMGFSDLKSFDASMVNNPDLHPKSRHEMLDLYNKYTDQMYLQIPKLFGRLPKAAVKIMAVPEYSEKEASGAAYNAGAIDGSRPGHVMVNTGDFANRMTLSIESTALHEGVPGHHMQISIAQELEGLPRFRQLGGYVAYEEGWALYSEKLGEELGFYQDLYSFYGHLQDEMLRAIRLVVDTGLHYKKWNRQQVVDFFHAHSGIEDVEVQSETDRYIVWPGQALGYKIGQLKILELRAFATKELGDQFDIREFHDVLLGSGALPLDVLEQQIKAWVKAKKK